MRNIEKPDTRSIRINASERSSIRSNAPGSLGHAQEVGVAGADEGGGS